MGWDFLGLAGLFFDRVFGLWAGWAFSGFKFSMYGRVGF